MIPTESTEYEEARLRTLYSYHILDTAPEKAFDQIVQLAADLCHSSAAMITLIDRDRQFIKASWGWDISDTSREDSFCTHAIQSSADLVRVPDARQDPRFQNNPFVLGKPHIRSYWAEVLRSPEGYGLGTLCVLNDTPQTLNDQQLRALKILSDQVVHLLELHKTNALLDAARNDWKSENERYHRILEATRVGTWEWNIKTGALYINPRWAEIAGYTIEELQPVSIKTRYELVHPGDRAPSDQMLNSCIRGELEFYDMELRIRHKDGHWRWIHDRGKVVLRDDKGQALMMSGTHTDVHDKISAKEHYIALTDNLPMVVYKYFLRPDGSSGLLQVSRGAQEIWGFSAEEAMNDNSLITNRVHPEDWDVMMEAVNTSAENESIWNFKWQYHHPDGSIRWHRGKGKPARQHDGTVIWDSFVEDITPTEKLQEEIRIHQAHTDDLLNTTSDLIWSFDTQYRLLMANRAYHQSLEQITGKAISNGMSIIETISPFFPQEKMDYWKIQFDRALHGEAHQVQEIYPMPDGLPDRVRNISFVPMRRENGTIEGVAAYAKDISSLYHANQSLQDSEKRYHDLFELSPQPMWVYALDDLRFLTVNEAAIRHYGFSREEFLSMTIRDIRPPEDIALMEAAVNLVRPHDQYYYHGMFRHRKKDGSIIQVEIQSNAIQFNGIKADLNLSVDVTDKLEYVEKITRQNERLREIAWIQSHILRAPVARIMGLVDILSDPTLLEEERFEMLSHISNSMRELDSITHEITKKAEQVESGLN